ncbi:hypothetical protein NHX12_032168 [Muraenolepis orangiensis]|uniref:Uncharacterized protein n=1 Tax=Muraenolepis orangiensis TaxID=630683 RepID=A0A9Q0IKD3_9TELE|nr:hypothetical protein NHX12_032168 [Muraenolepis orangiensis]
MRIPEPRHRRRRQKNHPTKRLKPPGASLLLKTEIAAERKRYEGERTEVTRTLTVVEKRENKKEDVSTLNEPPRALGSHRVKRDQSHTPKEEEQPIVRSARQPTGSTSESLRAQMILAHISKKTFKRPNDGSPILKPIDITDYKKDEDRDEEEMKEQDEKEMEEDRDEEEMDKEMEEEEDRVEEEKDRGDEEMGENQE